MDDLIAVCNTCRYRFGLPMDFAIKEHETCEVCDRHVLCVSTLLDDMRPEREWISMATVNRRVGKIPQVGEDGPFTDVIYPKATEGLEKFWAQE